MRKPPKRLAKAEEPEVPRDLEVAKGQADRVRRGPASNRPLGKEKEKAEKARAKEKEKEKEKEKVKRAKAKAKGKAKEAKKVRVKVEIRKVGYGTQMFSAST